MSDQRLLWTTAARLIAATPLCLAASVLQAQTAAPVTTTTSTAAPSSTSPSTDPSAAADTPAAEARLPSFSDLGLAVPRPVRAASAMLGMGRQRLALVLGVGTLGSRTVLDNAARDTQAVAQALREGGFIVMQREDLTAADLRAALKEFQSRLQPGGIGFVYASALGAQVDGQNLLLPRDVQLDASQPLAAREAVLRSQAVPLSEVVNALMGPAGSPRLMVVDAAWRHPALADLPAQGLNAQRLPPGVIALFGAALGTVREVPAVAALPPAGASANTMKPEQMAATPFARTLVGQLMSSRAKAPDALRATRRALVDGSLGLSEPWIGGDTEPEELAEATLLDGLVPRTPEDLAREAARQLTRTATRAPAAAAGNAATSAGGTLASTASNTVAGTASSAATGAGEQSVNDVLEEARRNRPVNARAAAEATSQNAAADTMRPTSARGAASESGGLGQPSAETPRPSLAQAPAAGNVLSQAASAAGTAARVAAGVATTAVGAAAVAKAAEAAATVSVAGAAIGAAGSLAGQAVALATRGGGGATAAEAQVAAAATAAAGGGVSTASTASAARALAAAGASPSVAAATAAGAPLSAAAPVVAAAATAPAGPLASTVPAVRVAASVEQVLAEARRPSSSALAPADGRTVRSANGGERPAHVPRSNAFGYAEGDTYTYQVIDTWKDQVTGRTTTAIEEVLDDGRLLANGQQVQLDAQGRLLWRANSDGTVSLFEPRQELWWSNPKRGEDRDLRFTETLRRDTPRVTGAGRRDAGGTTLNEIEWKGSASVGRLRKMELPAGEFEVLPIESSGWQYARLSDGSRVDSKWSRTVWYSPKLGHPVAIDIEDTDHLGRLLRRERVELLHAQAARQTP